MSKAFTSLVYSIQEKEKTFLPTSDVKAKTSDSLSFIRGAAFFSSAFVQKNPKGLWVIPLKEHYNRLGQSYKLIYERDRLPFSYAEFQSLVQETLEKNKEHEDNVPFNAQFFLLGGKPNSYGDSDRPYISGFGGNITTLMMLINPLKYKPEWCYESGVNLYSITYQRQVAEAKASYYLASVLGQHILDALNHYVLLEVSLGDCKPETMFSRLQEMLKEYQQWSIEQQKAFRITMNSFMDGSPSILFKENSTIKNVLDRGITKVTNRDINLLKDNHASELLHELLFVTDDDPCLILEGSTFAVMGIDQENCLRFVPLKNNSLKKHADDNQGKVLLSSSVLWIASVAKKLNIPIKIGKFTMEEAFGFKQLYMLSSLRLKVELDHFQIQPVRSINGNIFGGKDKASEALMEMLTKGCSDFLRDYSYEEEHVHPLEC